MRQSNEEKVTDDQVQDPGDQTASVYHGDPKEFHAR